LGTYDYDKLIVFWN